MKAEKNSRILLAFSLIFIVCVYFFPVWRINLKAPQYPEGLGLYIWMSDITGQAKHDLQKINNLNHYIGMQEIVPVEIPEFTIMPVVFGLVGLLCLLALITGNRRMLKVWLLAFVLFGIVGVADFYYWSYDYGHNLDPSAPIKVPGMSYQPPIFGTKLLLNFEASSYPATGALFAGAAFLLGLAAFWITRDKVNE